MLCMAFRGRHTARPRTLGDGAQCSAEGDGGVFLKGLLDVCEGQGAYCLMYVRGRGRI